MAEHYDSAALERTSRLYADVAAWASERGDVTVIGGWAVYELVAPGRAMQSRDVDLVLQTEEALIDLLQRLREWSLTLRSKGRKVFPDAHFSDEPPTAFRLDLFTANLHPTWERTFGRAGAQNVKPVPSGLYPDLDWVIRDKLHTLPLRTGPDRDDKRAKDCIDLFHLVFHNRRGISARQLADTIPSPLRANALGYVDDASKTRPEYEASIETLQAWLGAKRAST